MYRLTPSVLPTDVPQTLAFAQTGERVCFPLSPLCASEFLSTLAYFRAHRGGDASSLDAAGATSSRVTVAHRARALAALSPAYTVLSGADADALVLRDSRGIATSGSDADAGMDADSDADVGADAGAGAGADVAAIASAPAQVLATTVSYVLCLPRAWSPLGGVDTGSVRARVTPRLLAPLLAARAGDAAASLSLAAPYGLANTELRISLGEWRRGCGVPVDLIGSGGRTSGEGAGDAALMSAANAIAAAAVADLTMAALVQQALHARAAAQSVANSDGDDCVVVGGNAKRTRSGDHGAPESSAHLAAAEVRVGGLYVSVHLSCGGTFTVEASRADCALEYAGGGGEHTVEVAIASELARTAQCGTIDRQCLERLCGIVAARKSG